MKLTKQQAIEEHRTMWNWIADQLEEAEDLKNNRCTPVILYEIWNLKIKYIEKLEYNLLNDCFCCEYDRLRKGDCSCCPLCWGTENKVKDYFCEDGFNIRSLNEKYEINLEVKDYEEATGLYDFAEQLSEEKMYKEAAEIARQIANLPEKDDEE